MRLLFWLLSIAAAATLAALLLREFSGNVVLLVPPYRVDMSIAAFVLALLVLFALLGVAYTVLAALWRLPRAAAAYRRESQQARSRAALARAVVELAAGRFSRALQAAELARGDADLRAAALLVALQAAHRLRDRERRDAIQTAGHEFAQATQASPEFREALRMIAANAALEEQNPAAALEQLNQLGSGAARRVQALRLKLAAARQGGAADEVLRIAHLLEKHHDLPAEAALAIKEQAALQALSDARWDSDKLKARLGSLEAELRLRPRVATSAADWLAAAGMRSGARELLASAIDAALAKVEAAQTTGEGPTPVRPLAIALLRHLDVLDTAMLSRIETWQRQFGAADAALGLLLGAGCRRMELWGKARQALGAAAQSSDPAIASRAEYELALLARDLGETETAQAHFERAAGAFNDALGSASR
jgi:HemY protein